jgi:hypothetical protein
MRVPECITHISHYMQRLIEREALQGNARIDR